MAEAPLSVGRAPCGSCPYRRDVPSGVWDAHEYNKLPRFDGEILDQAITGAANLFMCHQQDGKLCAGWVGCHGPENLLALRLAPVDAAVWDYKSPVPLFGSCQEASDHGKRDIAQPGKAARRLIAKLLRRRRVT